MAKRGRPRGSRSSKAKQATILARVSPSTRKRIEAAALANDWSISREIEHRLEASFGEVERVEEALGGLATSAFLRVVGQNFRVIERDSGKRWWTDRWTHDECVDFVNALFAAWQPQGERIDPAPNPPRPFPGTSQLIPSGGPVSGKVRAAMAISYLRAVSDEVVPVDQRTASVLGSVLGSKMREDLE